jgi:flagellar basal-body rod protein FlgC
MSGLFPSLGVSASGMVTMRTWLDAISHNVANVNTANRTSEAPVHETFVIAKSVAGEPVGNGVRVTQTAHSEGPGRYVYDPNNPLADENGLVQYPDIDMVDQMTNLIIAQRAYQANVTVFERARDAYLRALEIGRQ